MCCRVDEVISITYKKRLERTVAIMADVYKFKVKLRELPKIMWRDIEISSTATLSELAYAVLVAFEATASHLFNIRFKGVCYDISFKDEETERVLNEQCKNLFQEILEGIGVKLPEEINDIYMEPTMNPTKIKLSELKLVRGNVLNMEYDFGAEWLFSIKLTHITEMKKDTETHYPYVIDGQGKGIIEDICPFELAEIIREANETGNLPKIYDAFSDEEEGVEWDYNDFDLEHCNRFLKDKIHEMQSLYEE